MARDRVLASTTSTTQFDTSDASNAPPLHALPAGVVLVGWLLVLVVVAFAVRKVAQRLVFFLGKDEQLVVVELTDTTVRNGPGIVAVSPFVKDARKRKAELLEPLDFVKVKDTLTGEVRVEVGPSLIFLRAFDEVQGRGQAQSLTPQEYCKVLDMRTGESRIERGPCVLMPGAYEEISPKQGGYSLESNQFVKLSDKSSGKRWTVHGPCLFMPEKATWDVQGGIKPALSLKKTEYVRLIDETTGAIRVERGEQMVFPEATETILKEDGGVLTAINLKVFQYVKIIDASTGVIRVVKGEATVFLGPTEKLVGRGKVDAVEIDQETAVQVRSKRTGELTLCTEAGLFFPKAEEEIVEVQKLIKLADYECMIVADAQGVLSYFYGDDAKRGSKPRAFFVPPHNAVYTLTWSRGRRREQRDLVIERLDVRPQFMSFEFNCRTSDNVELVLEGTFFWQIVDVEVMVAMTGDTTGDICNHARSRFIQLVSKVTLKEFMDTFNSLAEQAHQGDDDFYSRRGVRVHTLEVTAYRCQDHSTARILEQIIQETTNRMNRLSQQESENEIKM